MRDSGGDALGNDPVSNEACEFVWREAEEAAKDCFVCLAQESCRPLNLALCGMQPHWQPGMLDYAWLRMHQREHIVSSSQVYVAPEVFTCLHCTSRDSRCL